MLKKRIFRDWIYFYLRIWSKLIKNSNYMKPKFTMILMLLALSVQMVFAQQKTVSGTVSDENGLPLPGATEIRRDY